MKRVLMWSGGKDSTATAIVAKLNGLPIDRIVTVMPDPFRCELELLEKFQDWMGMRVEVVEGPKFEDFFFRVKVRGVNKGGIYGWPKIRQKACARMLKWMPQAEWHRKNPGHQAIVGIAADEAHRMTSANLMSAKFERKYPLVEWNMDEAACLAYCRTRGFDWGGLYDIFPRVSCYCCPLQCIGQLRNLRRHFPALWTQMLTWDAEIGAHNRGFKGYDKVADLERRFAQEDRQGTFPGMANH